MWLAVEWVGLLVKWVEFDGAVLGLMMHVHMSVVFRTFLHSYRSTCNAIHVYTCIYMYIYVYI